MEELEKTDLYEEAAETDEPADAEENREDAPPEDSQNEPEESAAVDYAELARADMEELRSLFPHLRDKTSIAELSNPLRYAALRDLGLTPKEAYLAIGEPVPKYDNRSHLRSSVPKSASAPTGILTRGELEAARELFSGLSDREIQKLYKKVSR